MLKAAAFWFLVFGCNVIAMANGFATSSTNLEILLELKDVCSDFEEIPVSSVKFPSDSNKYLNAIKERTSAKFYYSKTMISNWNKIEGLPVQGLNATVSQIFSFLQNQSCFVFPWGGSIRDLVLGHFVADIDAEITCDPFEILEACIPKFGAKNCQRHHRGNLKIIIGNFEEQMPSDKPMIEPMDLAHWNETFGSRKSALEFTANSLSYFPDTGILIDISGKALIDICSGEIRIPARKKYWTQWRGKNTIDKLLRYWTLRSKGFHPANEGIRKFIFAELQQNFSGKEAKHFLCHKFFEGKLENNGKCQVYGEDKDGIRKAKLELFLKTLQTDFGFQNARNQFKELFEELEIVYKF